MIDLLRALETEGQVDYGQIFHLKKTRRLCLSLWTATEKPVGGALTLKLTKAFHDHHCCYRAVVNQYAFIINS